MARALFRLKTHPSLALGVYSSVYRAKSFARSSYFDSAQIGKGEDRFIMGVEGQVSAKFSTPSAFSLPATQAIYADLCAQEYGRPENKCPIKRRLINPG
jgi:hypothetical protein